jgi:hypothetical protein
MSKFIKRIQKNAKRPTDTVVMVGTDQTNIENIINGFNTVFSIGCPQPLPRYKNIIPLEDSAFLNDLHSVDIIFLTVNFNSDLFQFIPHLVRKCAPDIFLHNNLVLSTEYIDFFKRIRYEQITILDDYQIWKIIRK